MILLENRTFRIREDIAQRVKDYILEQFAVDYKAYDVIAGYRADESKFVEQADIILERYKTTQKSKLQKIRKVLGVAMASTSNI